MNDQLRQAIAAAVRGEHLTNPKSATTYAYFDDVADAVLAVIEADPTIRRWKAAYDATPWSVDCWCAACDEAKQSEAPTAALRLMSRRMNICPACGSKRCERAASHEAECTAGGAA